MKSLPHLSMFFFLTRALEHVLTYGTQVCEWQPVPWGNAELFVAPTASGPGLLFSAALEKIGFTFESML
jgi:hypothetical protein